MKKSDKKVTILLVEKSDNLRTVLKDYLEPILRKVPNNRPEYSEAYRLRKFLEYFVSVQDKELPPTSLLREFLGGSSFNY